MADRRTTEYIKSKGQRGDLVALGKILVDAGDKMPSDTRPVLLRDNFDTLDTTVWDKSGTVTAKSGLLEIKTDGYITTRDDDKDTYRTFEYGVFIFTAKVKSDSVIGFTDGKSYVQINGSKFETYNNAIDQKTEYDFTLDDDKYHIYSVFWTPDWVRLEIDNEEMCTLGTNIPAVPMYLKLTAGSTNDLSIDAINLFPMGQITGLEGGFLRMTGKFVVPNFQVTYHTSMGTSLSPSTTDDTSGVAADDTYLYYIHEESGALDVCWIWMETFDGLTQSNFVALANDYLSTENPTGAAANPLTVEPNTSSSSASYTKLIYYGQNTDTFYWWSVDDSGVTSGSFACPITGKNYRDLTAYNDYLWGVSANDTTVYCIKISTEARNTDREFTHEGTNPFTIAFISATQKILIWDADDERVYYYDASDPTNIVYESRSQPVNLGSSTSGANLTATQEASPRYFANQDSTASINELKQPSQRPVLVDQLPEMWSNWEELISNTDNLPSNIDLLSNIASMLASTINVDTELTMSAASTVVTIADVDALFYGWDSGAGLWEKIHTDGNHRLLVYDAQLTSVIDVMSTVEVDTDYMGSAFASAVGQLSDLSITASQATLILSQFDLSATDATLSTVTQLLSQFNLSTVDAQLVSVVGQLSDVSTLLSQFDLSSTDALLASVWTELHGTINDDLLDILSTIDQCCLATHYNPSNTDSLIYKTVMYLSYITGYVDGLEGYALSQVGQLSDLSLAVSNAQLILSQFDLSSTDALLQSGVDLQSMMDATLTTIDGSIDNLETLQQSTIDLVSTLVQLASQYDLSNVETYLAQYDLSSTDTLLQSVVDSLGDINLNVDGLEALESSSVDVLKQFDLSNTDVLLSTVTQLLSQFDVSNTDAYLLSQVGQLSDIAVALSNNTYQTRLLLSQFDLSGTDGYLASSLEALSDVSLLQQSAVDLLSQVEAGVTIEQEPTASDADGLISAVVVGSTATFILSIATSGVMLLINDLQASTPDVVYIGSSGVTISTGTPLQDGRPLTYENIIGAVYGICDATTQEIRFQKFSNT